MSAVMSDLPVGSHPPVDPELHDDDGRDVVADTNPVAAVIRVSPPNQSASNDGLSITFSEFQDVRATKVTVHAISWGDFTERLMHPKNEQGSKSECHLIKLATFGDKRSQKNSLRTDENMLEVFGIEGDYDAEKVTVEEAAALLTEHGIEALIYTSASHGISNPPHSHGGPRWRVLAPLSSAYPKGARKKFAAKLNWALGGILGRESFTDSQSFYFGKVRGVEYVCRRVEGRLLDEVADTLDETYPGTGGEARHEYRPAAPARDQDTLDRAVKLAEVTPETIETLWSAMSVFTEADADDYIFWASRMGQALKSLEQAGYGEDALNMWHSFSTLSPRYDPHVADAKWQTFQPDSITYKSIFHWAAERGWINPKSAAALTADTRIDRTDAGNMNLLAQISDGNLRYVQEPRFWIWWDGEKWIQDNYGSKAQAQALQVAEHYNRQVIELKKRLAPLSGDERRDMQKIIKSLEAWMKHCRNKRNIDAMLNLAKADSRFTISIRDLDTDPWLFGVENGVVDLRTGTLRQAGRDDYVTKRAPVRFDPQARAPRFLQFIEEITGRPAPTPQNVCHYQARPALADYLQRVLGYCMTGSTVEHKIFLAIGAGANGKNVLLDLLQGLMGDYCQQIAPEALMASKRDDDPERPTPGLRRLAGARMAVASESKDGHRLDVALIKRHTGGGYMLARGMKENTMQFEITYKLWLMTNHTPALDNLDDAMRGRLHMIPFDMRWNRPGHPDRDPRLPDGDKDLAEKLREEAEGELAWLVAGAVMYHREGLEPPAEVVAKTRTYFNDQDPMGKWLETMTPCATKDGDMASALFTEFCRWRDAEWFHQSGPTTQRAFSDELQQRGIEKKPIKEGTRYGLRKKADADLQEIAD